MQAIPEHGSAAKIWATAVSNLSSEICDECSYTCTFPATPQCQLSLVRWYPWQAVWKSPALVLNDSPFALQPRQYNFKVLA